MIKNILKQNIITAFQKSLVRQFFSYFSKGCKLLYHHGVENEIINPHVQNVHWNFQNFEKHIINLKKFYKIISLDELVFCINNDLKINKNSLVLTFDDGYKNNVAIVLPYLKSENIPFSVFICTKNISSGERFPMYLLAASIFDNNVNKLKFSSLNTEYSINSDNDKISAYQFIRTAMLSSSQNNLEKILNDIKNSMPRDRWIEINNKYSSDEPMNWDDVKTLHNNNVIIGSHGHEHFIFNKEQTFNSITNQFVKSKKLIKEHIQDCKYFCYPNGGFADISIDSYNISKEHFECCLTTFKSELTVNSDKYLLPRIQPRQDMQYDNFKMSTAFLNNKHYTEEYNKFIS